MKKLYFILSRSNTMMALGIRIFTNRYYNHVSMSLDSSLDEFFSFGRLYPWLTLPAGFVTESKRRGFYKIHPNIPVKVIEVEVTDEEYNIVCERLGEFRSNPRRFKYDLIHIPHMMRRKQYEIGDNYVCSVFVATLLKDIIDFGKHRSLVYPEDFNNLESKVIFEGRIKDYNYEEQ